MEPMSRRKMLASAGVAGAALAVGPSGPVETQARESEPGKPKLKVIVTGGHPGDPEYGCGGTVARYTDLGHEAVLLYLNRGELPDRPESKGVRVAEALKACELLKARPVFAAQIDGHAIVDGIHYDEFRRLLEIERPNVVFTHWPID